MVITITNMKIVFAGVMTIISTFLGGFDFILKILLILIVADYITGVLLAVSTKQLSSEVGLKGIVKKIMQLFIVGVAAVIDQLTGTQGEYVRTIVIYFLIANEGISILENASAVGAPVPEFLIKILQQIKDKEGVNK